MMSIHIRRTVAILVLAAASSLLPATDLSAAPRHESPDGGLTRVLRQSHPVWRFLMSLWEENGLRIDDNG
jgi:hypothetical protein